jgi:hypothetical protein
LYATTPDFMGHFGFSSLEDLPPLSVEEDQPGDAVDIFAADSHDGSAPTLQEE